MRHLGFDSRTPAPSCIRLVVLLVATVISSGCWGEPTEPIGVRSGTLAPCPATPNCVHTGLRHPDGTTRIFLQGSLLRRDLIPSLKAVLEAMPRTTIVSDTDQYIHAVVRSRLFRFPDDLELYISPDRELIVRSASRVGRSDLGVNAARVTELRRLLVEADLIR